MPSRISLRATGARRLIASSPPMQWALSWMRDVCVNAIQQGPVPQHVAFVMDGNRRFARKSHIETAEGHNMGFEALAKILEVCYKSGVKVVTVYAFSIENFKRSKYEVDALMDIAKIKLQQLSQHGALMDQYGASIRVLGQRDLVQPDVKVEIEKAVDMTKHNKKAVLNVCFPYTSREEITSSIRSVVSLSTNPNPPDGSPTEESSSTLVNDADSDTTPVPQLLDPESITESTLNKHLYTAGMPPPDILIRTSGVERLSDFMLWQCNKDTHIEFVDCLWPEFDIWKFLPILVGWQVRQKKQVERERGEGWDWITHEGRSVSSKAVKAS